MIGSVVDQWLDILDAVILDTGGFTDPRSLTAMLDISRVQVVIQLSKPRAILHDYVKFFEIVSGLVKPCLCLVHFADLGGIVRKPD